MFFTVEDFDKIYSYISKKSVKDTQLPSITTIDGSEILTIVQNATNKKMSLGELGELIDEHNIPIQVQQTEGQSVKMVMSQKAVTDRLNEIRTALRYREASDTNRMYLVLNKNESFSSQVTEEDAIYEIQSDFDLDEETVNLPKNCVLKFNGGKILNGTLVGNYTSIDSPNNYILSNLEFGGTWTKPFEADWVIAGGDPIGTPYAQCTDCSEELNTVFNSGIRNIHFSSPKLYYVTDTIVVRKFLNITGDFSFETYQEDNYCRIESDSNITILKYIVPKVKRFAERLCIKGIGLRSGSSTVLDKTTPILKITNNDANSNSMWGTHIDCRISGRNSASDEITGSTVNSMTGIEIESGPTGNYISYTRIGGYISTFRGIYVHGTEWITDTLITAETSCVQGGYFEKGFPVNIKNTHQTNGYWANPNDVGYFEGNGQFQNYGRVWDVGNTSAPYRAKYDFICAIYEGPGDSIYQNSKVSYFPDRFLKLARYNFRYSSINDIPNFTAQISNNPDFENDGDENVTLNARDYIIGYEYLVNTASSIGTNIDIPSRKQKIARKVPLFTTEFQEIYDTWDAIYIRYTGSMESFRSTAVGTAISIQQYKMSPKLTIFDSNDNIVYQENIITEGGSESYINIPLNIHNVETPETFQLDFHWIKNASSDYNNSKAQLAVPTFNFTARNNYQSRVSKISSPDVLGYYKTEDANQRTYYYLHQLFGKFSLLNKTKSEYFRIDGSCIFWVALISKIDQSLHLVLCSIASNDTVIIYGLPANQSLTVTKYKPSEDDTTSTPEYAISCPNNSSSYFTILRIDGLAYDFKGNTDYTYSEDLVPTIYKTKNLVDYRLKTSGTTVERTSMTTSYSSALYIGFQFFDTTLSYPVFWTGTKWVDSNGIDAD